MSPDVSDRCQQETQETYAEIVEGDTAAKSLASTKYMLPESSINAKTLLKGIAAKSLACQTASIPLW